MTALPQEQATCLPLESGDRLTRDEFERRYNTRSDIKKAELVEGVVFVASPVRVFEHGRQHIHMGFWLATYEMQHPGVYVADNSTVRFDACNELQPDLVLFRDPAAGGQTQVNDEGYLVGAPELVVEISASSASYDLGAKKDAYRRNGVREYIVWQILEERIDWFRLTDTAYEIIAPAAGLIESDQFPGLRLNVRAMLAGDLAAVQAALS